MTPDRIVAAPRRYIGTPYHHQGMLAGAGCDCLGLIRGVWRDLYGFEPEVPAPWQMGAAASASIALQRMQATPI